MGVWQSEGSAGTASCDESKCVSFGMSINGSFTCYANDDEYPMMCADGFKPLDVTNEPPVLDESGNFLYRYFTCCQPDLSPPLPSNFIRHCSDSFSIASDFDDNNTSICDHNTTRSYPRHLKTDKAYMCCDSVINYTTSKNVDFLGETECVPYNDEHYTANIIPKDEYGRIHPITCNADPNNEFRFAHRATNTNHSQYTHYHCCKTGPESTPFFQDNTFKLTVYPQIVASGVAVCCCLVLILGLSIPLYLNLRKPTEERRRRSLGNMYSTYNLYLVYLAFPDLIFNLYFLGMYGSYANQKYNPKIYGYIIRNLADETTTNGISPSQILESSFCLGCAVANLYLNAIVAHEVLLLLQKSQQLQRSNPPSLRKVTLQAIAVYCLAIVIFLCHYFVGNATTDVFFTSCGISFVILIIPIGYLCYVSIIIWHRGLMELSLERTPTTSRRRLSRTIPSNEILPSTSAAFQQSERISSASRRMSSTTNGRLKELVWYFLRIIVIFLLIWIPGFVCWFLAIFGPREFEGICISIGYLFCALQPIVSTCMAMTKSDVKQYVFDLITLTYFRCNLDRRPHVQPKGHNPADAVSYTTDSLH